jgi:hypothetical protein
MKVHKSSAATPSRSFSKSANGLGHGPGEAKGVRSGEAIMWRPCLTNTLPNLMLVRCTHQLLAGMSNYLCDDSIIISP